MNQFLQIALAISGLYLTTVLLEYYIGLLRIRYNFRPPHSFSTFPEYASSGGNLLAVRNRIDTFKSLTLEGVPSYLKITAADLNDLECEGESVNKFSPGIYYYFTIQKDFILEDLLEWPSIPGVWACRRRLREIRFLLKEGELRTSANTIQEYNNKISESSDWIELSLSTLIQMIFGNTNQPYHFLLLSQDTDEYKNIKSFSKLITDIKFDDGALYFFSNNLHWNDNADLFL